MSNNKRIETLIAQYYSLCKSRHSSIISTLDAENKIYNVRKELYTTLEMDKECRDVKKRYLYKVLFSTKALDTSLRTFLEIHDAWPCGKNPPSIGGYINALQKSGHTYSVLGSHIARSVQEDIVDGRNKFLHSAGAYPTRLEQEKMFDKIMEIMQTVINL